MMSKVMPKLRRRYIEDLLKEFMEDHSTTLHDGTVQSPAKEQAEIILGQQH